MAAQHHDQAEQSESGVARRLGHQEAEQDAAPEADTLHDDELLRPDLGRHSGDEEPVAEPVGALAGKEPGDHLPEEPSQRTDQPGGERVLQADGELVEDRRLGVELGQHRLGVDLRLPRGLDHEHGTHGGQGETQSEEHRRVHQMSILTMRMIIPIPTPTDTAAPRRTKRPGARSMGSR